MDKIGKQLGLAMRD